MPPERIFGHADEKSEIYSLGAILYSIVSLENLYRENDLKELIRKITKGSYKPLEEYESLPHFPKGTISDSLIFITTKALQLEPVDRYDSILQLKQDLESYLMGYAPEAESTSLTKAFRLLIARHKKLSITLFTLIIITLIFCLGFAYTIMKEQRQAEMEFKFAKKLENEASQKAIVAEEKENELKAKISALQYNAPVLYENAVNFLYDQNTDKALQNLTHALSLKPNMKNAQALKGSILLALGLYNKAQKSLNLVRSHSPYILEDIKFCKVFKKRSPEKSPSEEYLKLYKHFMATNRISEAILVLEKLSDLKDYDRLLMLTWKKRLNQTPFAPILQSKDLIDLTINKGLFQITIKAPYIFDLSPIKNMPISELTIHNSKISSLAFAENMPLEVLNISSSQITNLETLRDKNIIHLDISNTPISSLEPLQNAPIKHLNISGTDIKNLDNIKNMPLTQQFVA